jgi:hypothetical protein
MAVHIGDRNMERFAPELAASIDSGKPVVGYDDNWDMAVIHGYLEGGKKLLLRDYWSREGVNELPISKMNGFWYTLQQHQEPAALRDSAIAALEMAAHHWRRVSAKTGLGEYWYGDAAWEHWLHDVGQGGSFTDEQRSKLFCCHRLVFLMLLDARKEAAAFLTEHASFLPQPARQAADIYGQAVQFMTSNPSRIMPNGDSQEWTPEVRGRQIEFLTEVRRLDAAAIVEVEKALAALR